MLETLKLRANLIESACLIFVNCFLSCMIIVSFYTYGLRWSICFLQSRRGSQGWHFLFLLRGVSHSRKGGATLKKVIQKNSFTFSLFSCRRNETNNTNLQVSLVQRVCSIDYYLTWFVGLPPFAIWGNQTKRPMRPSCSSVFGIVAWLLSHSFCNYSLSIVYWGPV